MIPERAKILLVWDHMGDYHRARWQALMATNQGNVWAADLGSGDGLYGWQSSEDECHFILSQKAVEASDIIGRLRAFRQILKQHAIEVVALAGYGRLEYLLMILLARAMGKRVILFAESWYPGKRDTIKRLILSHWVSGLFVSGQRALDYFTRVLGFPADRVATGYSTVDNQHFVTRKSARRNELICVARFAPEKNLVTLVRAFERSVLSSDWTLRIVGGGPLEGQLRQEIKVASIELEGWQEYEDIPGRYHSAKYLVLPSRFEPWGLVVNEAMAAGLPVIISSACGCEPDLLQGNGWSFDPHSEDQLVEVLNELPGIDPDEWNKMSQRSLEIIQKYSPEHWARNFMALATAKE